MNSLGVPADFAAVTGVDPRAHAKQLPRRLERFSLTEQPQARALKFDIAVTERYRGRGLGTSLLSAVCRYADAKRLPVWGHVLGDGEGAMAAINTLRLINWYRRFGFGEPTAADRRRYRISGQGPPTLIRQPRP